MVALRSRRNWRWEGPLGTPLGLVHWKRASSAVEAGTSGFVSISDSDRKVLAELGQESQASSWVEAWNSTLSASLPAPFSLFSAQQQSREVLFKRKSYYSALPLKAFQGCPISDPQMGGSHQVIPDPLLLFLK